MSKAIRIWATIVLLLGSAVSYCVGGINGFYASKLIGIESAATRKLALDQRYSAGLLMALALIAFAAGLAAPLVQNRVGNPKLEVILLSPRGSAAWPTWKCYCASLVILGVVAWV
jgi:hypothetical protein